MRFVRTLKWFALSTAALLLMIAKGNSFEAPSGVRGRVVYVGGDYAPIQRAYILVHPVYGDGATDRHTYTDRSGEYALELAPGIYDVFISAPQNVPASRKIEVTPDGMMVFNANLSVSDIGMEID